MAIKKPKLKNAYKIKTPLFEDNHPAFSFKYIINNNKYNLDSPKATSNLQCKFLRAMHNYSQQSWTNFIGDKKNTGVEVIGYSDLRKCQVHFPKTPFYDAIKDIVIFRISNKSGRIVGRRVNNICYILWLDWDFSSYDHGS